MPLLALADLPDALPQRGCLLGLDVGTKTIGLAISDPRWNLASPLKTIQRKKFSADAMELEKIIADRKIVGLIMGLPRALDGTQTPMTQSVQEFARNLMARHALAPHPLCTWDERLSTLTMERELIGLDTTRAKRKKVIDQMAAQYILQGALDYLVNIQSHEI